MTRQQLGTAGLPGIESYGLGTVDSGVEMEGMTDRDKQHRSGAL